VGTPASRPRAVRSTGQQVAHDTSGFEADCLFRRRRGGSAMLPVVAGKSAQMPNSDKTKVIASAAIFFCGVGGSFALAAAWCASAGAACLLLCLAAAILILSGDTESEP